MNKRNKALFLLGLVVLAIAQMGVHLVFFLHITTGPDNTNNVLALAFWCARRIGSCARNVQHWASPSPQPGSMPAE